MVYVRYPLDAPKGKGGRVKEASGFMGTPVRLPAMYITEQYRKRYRLQVARSTRVTLSGLSFKRLMTSFTGRFGSADVVGLGTTAAASEELDYDVEAGAANTDDLQVSSFSRGLSSVEGMGNSVLDMDEPVTIVTGQQHAVCFEHDSGANGQCRSTNATLDLEDDDVMNLIPEAAPDSPSLHEYEQSGSIEAGGSDGQAPIERAFSDADFLRGL